ncbi:hypothetical protein ASZ90_016283 [hydrocarbon metagenome]|uniref:Uncharacterized protein n=1 Tax=hydrocarbon metagenome TaxID=938273 RepID=A0A0W8EZL5_9ZZZZ
MVYRLLDRRGRDAKGPESPVSTGTWAGDIKPFLEREATCRRRDTLPDKGGTPGVLEQGKDPDDQERTSLSRERQVMVCCPANERGIVGKRDPCSPV